MGKVVRPILEEEDVKQLVAVEEDGDSIKRTSAKAKGRLLQKVVAELIRKRFNLEDRDVCSTPASVTGEDILLSEKAKKLFPYSVEVKNQERLSIWSAIEQANSNSNGREPIVVFKRNRSGIYVCLEFDKFLDMIK